MSEHRKLESHLGIAGTAFTIIGFVLGISIFALPKEIAEVAGPGVAISLLISGIPAFFSCFVAAQAGSIFPTSGCMYVGTSTVLSPFWGFIIVWNVLIAMVVGIPFAAYVFVDYSMYFVPGVVIAPGVYVAGACGITLICGLVNLFGVRTTVAVQATMISVYIVVMLVFGIGGLFHIEPNNYEPLFPHGFGPVLLGGIIAAYSFNGFMVITEMGDEIKRPQRTIPIALLISYLTVLVIFGLVCFVTPGIVPLGQLTADTMNAPVATAADTFLPGWFGTLITISALLGAATSINAWFLTQTRDVYALARDQVFPKVMAHVSKKYEEPDVAVIFCVMATVGGVLLGRDVQDYAILTVFASFSIFVVAAIMVLFTPRRVPELYNHAKFKLGKFWLPFFCVGFAIICLVFLVFGVLQAPDIALIYLVLLAPGIAYYFARKHYLRRRGIRIEDLLRKDLSHILTRED